jgi:alanyl-tRNA synthetase
VKESRRSVKSLQEQIAAHEADALSGGAEDVAGVRTVLRSLEGWDAQGLKTLAMSIASRPGHRAVLVSATPPLLAAIARAPDAPGDAAGLLKTLTDRFGGRGGGKPDLAQGGGLGAPPADVLAAARALLEQKGH